MPFVLSAFADEAGPSCGEQVAALKEAGIRHIDVRNIDGHNITVLPLEQARKIREQLDAGGITVGMYGSPIGKIDIADDFNIDLEKLTHLGRLKPILGGTAVRLFSYYNKANRPHAEFRRESLSRLKQLKALAKDLGLTLYHENEGKIFGDRCEDVLAIAHELRDEGVGGNFKMIFDFGNYNVGGENPWDNWLKLASTTDAFHFKDCERTRDGQIHHVPVGAGGGKVHEILADAVKKNMHSGNIPVTVEPHLAHSAAVLATGPGGVANQAYSKMTTNQSFQIACKAAKEVLNRAGAAYV
jgi:sugar phosphate isomerase/epimerase